jgi:hypothetical protein
MSLDRRSFLKTTGMGITMLSLTGATLLLTPAEAYARKAPLKVLTKNEVAILEAFAEELLPGSAEAGVAHYIDEQLSRDANDNLLMARYFQIEPPMSGFYKAGLATLNGYCIQTFNSSFADMDPAQRTAFVGSMMNIGPEGPIDPEGWIGPPAAIFYMCVRSDTVDVVYGTMEGFAKLNVPYMAHIEPPAKW